MSLGRYILRRVLAALPLIFLLPLLTFLLMHLVPGNYFDALRVNPQISPETVREYERLYHLDQPVLVQYLHWVANLLRFDLGYSFSYKIPVLNLLWTRLPNTLLLTGSAFLLAWVAAFILGLFAGLRRNSFVDGFLNVTACLGLAMPQFLLCMILLYGASRAGGIPLGGIRSAMNDDLSWIGKILDLSRHMFIPVTVLGLSSFAFLFRVMRAQTGEIKDKDFVLFLRASRIPEWKILMKHIARNAANPMVSLAGLELPALVGGAAIVEIFTGWPGLGSLMLQAVRTQDLFLVLGNMVMIAVILVAGNLAADLLLAAVDPRVRLLEKAHES